MAFFTFIEIIHLIILTGAIGYIFSGYITDPSSRASFSRRWNTRNFLFAMLVTAPGVVLHELGHKFVGLAFGLGATFQVWYPGLGIAVFLKLINSPFLIVAPGYVLLTGVATPFESLLTSFAGPLVNLLLFAIAWLILRNSHHLTKRQAITLLLTQRINLFLFIFNMIPIPPLDGSKVLFNLIELIF